MAAVNEEMVTITKAEHDRLVERDVWLDCLEDAGVDNWHGCDVAAEILQMTENDCE